jgi:hypothetical protein
MAEPTDVREWARRQGIEIGDRGRIPKELQARYDAEQNGGEPLVAVPDPDPAGETRPFVPGPEPRSFATGKDGQTAETPPQPGKRRGIWRPRQPKTDQPARGKGAPKRVSLEMWAQRGWKALAYIAGAGQTPTSRCLNMQAPVAGIVLDDMIKGTVVDRLAQPIARWGEGGKNVAALVGLPLLVAATERQPALYQYTRPLMAEAATEWVLLAGPAMRKAKARAAEVARELEEFELDEESVKGMVERPAENPVIVKMLDAIFAPMMAPEPETAAAA